MSFISTPSYIEYLKMLPPCDEVDFSDLNYYLHEQPLLNNYFNIGPCVFYTFNYIKKQYEYVSGNLLHILGYRSEDFLAGGADFYKHIFQKDDLKVFSEQIFRNNTIFLSGIAPDERSSYRLSFTYRLKRKDGAYAVLLQQSSYLKTDLQGNPLLSFGVITDISPYKCDLKIVHHIEQLDAHGIYIPVETNYYFPDEQEGILSKREIEILKWIIEGLSSIEIADKLNRSTHTVRTHRKNLMEKTNAKNVAELIRYALDRKIV